MLTTINQKLSLFFIVLGIVFIIGSYLLPKYPLVPVDADIIPIFLGGILSLLGVLLYFVKDDNKSITRSKPLFNQDNIQIMGFIVAILIYIFLLEKIGFIIMTALFIFSTSYLLGYRHLLSNVLTSLLVPLFFYFSFMYLLKINLPSGILLL